MMADPPKIRTAVILAAGMGSRLRDIIADKPKGLLVIDGKELIKRSLECLADHGITRIVMVLGYLRETYIEALKTEFPQIRYLFNADFNQTGSMHSLFLARDQIREPFLLLESDLLYEARCISSLLEDPGDEAVLISGKTGSGDEVYVHGGAGLINYIAKTQHSDFISQGELVGISKISPALFRKMCEYYTSEVPFPSNFHYEDCISAVCSRIPVRYLKVEDIIWTEIDDPSHYRRALNLIYPRILEAKTSACN